MLILSSLLVDMAIGVPSTRFGRSGVRLTRRRVRARVVELAIFVASPRPSSPSIRSSHVASPSARLAAPLLLMSACAFAVGCGAGNGVSSDGPDVAFDACAPLTLITDAGVTDAQAAGIARRDAALERPRRNAPDAGAPIGGPRPGCPSTSRPPRPPSTAFTTRRAARCSSTPTSSGAPLAITIAHEIGHAFGLVHVPADQRTSVMNPNNLVVEPTAEDVDTLATRWGVCLASDHP